MDFNEDLWELLDDLVCCYGENPPTLGFGEPLYMIVRGKHYSQEQSIKVARGVVNRLRSVANKIEYACNCEEQK